MKCRWAHVTGGLLLTLACGPRTETGSGGRGETAGAGGDSVDAGTGGSGEPTAGADDGATAGADDGATAGTTSGGTAGTAGTGTSSGGTRPTGGPIPKDDGPQAEASKLDLLLAVDNSISMAAKHQFFAKAVPELVKRLVSPYCVSGAGVVVAKPAAPDQACPSGSEREFAPLRDLHIGVITSSLGSHGAQGARDVCVSVEDDDRAHLLPFVRANLSDYDGKGFLKWDPDGLATPPGESNVQALADSLEKMIISVGETGCGYEAQLESVYRFLVDPEPAASLEVGDDQQIQKVGVDLDLLEQRENFLRRDSSVAVFMLTDENDCSIRDEGYGWLVARSAPMYRSTSACLTNSNDPCCQSCGESEANAGCGDIASDSECQKGQFLSGAGSDDLNLRCFNQKGRFGFDLLYPIARYVSGFGDGTVPNRNGELVTNPLFHRNDKHRDRSLFTLAVVGGVPWQDLATSESLSGDNLEYMTPEALSSNNRWPLLLGNPAKNQPPLDPFMRESSYPRSGKNPIIDANIEPMTSTDPTANPINGHEYETAQRDLQYACTFELPEPVACDVQRELNGQGCGCYESDLAYNRPICNPPGGGAPTTTQYYGSAFPTVRPLAVARELGRRAALGSVCARNTQDETRADYGYRPVFGTLGRRIAATLVKQ